MVEPNNCIFRRCMGAIDPYNPLSIVLGIKFGILGSACGDYKWGFLGAGGIRSQWR